jgi:hypothetical protein
MTAHHFLITLRNTGALIAHALLCPAARYVSVRWRGTERFDRRFGGPPVWRAVEADLSIGWVLGRVDGVSMTYRLLVPEIQWGTLAVQKTAEVPIDASGHGAAGACDAYLRAQSWNP